jgi:hypothetical protein
MTAVAEQTSDRALTWGREVFELTGGMSYSAK